MAPPRTVTRRRAPHLALSAPEAEPADGVNEPSCLVQAEAIDRQTVVIQELVEEIRQTRIAFTPAADALHDLNSAQKKFCNFIVGHRLKLFLGFVAIVVAIGGISPNVASAVGSALKALGWS